MFSLGPQLRIFRTAQQAIRKASTAVAPKEIQHPATIGQNHHDLPSFLEYASRVELDPDSTVYVGTHYEYTVQPALEKLGMTLKRTGGKSDCGIDLLGTWNLPSAHRPLKVFVQCKTFTNGPSQARELEGAFAGAPPGWRGSGVLALLVSQKRATKGTREAIGRSRWPMGYVYCTTDGKILQMVWNMRAQERCLAGIVVGVKYEGGETSEREIILTYRGQALGEGMPMDSRIYQTSV